MRPCLFWQQAPNHVGVHPPWTFPLVQKLFEGPLRQPWVKLPPEHLELIFGSHVVPKQGYSPLLLEPNTNRKVPLHDPNKGWSLVIPNPGFQENLISTWNSTWISGKQLYEFGLFKQLHKQVCKQLPSQLSSHLYDFVFLENLKTGTQFWMPGTQPGSLENKTDPSICVYMHVCNQRYIPLKTILKIPRDS